MTDAFPIAPMLHGVPGALDVFANHGWPSRVPGAMAAGALAWSVRDALSAQRQERAAVAGG